METSGGGSGLRGGECLDWEEGLTRTNRRAGYAFSPWDSVACALTVFT